MMGYDKIVTANDSFVKHSFGYVKTQQSPCSFRICQPDLQAGIIKSILQWQRRKTFKGAYNFSNFHLYDRKFAQKYIFSTRYEIK